RPRSRTSAPRPRPATGEAALLRATNRPLSCWPPACPRRRPGGVLGAGVLCCTARVCAARLTGWPCRAGGCPGVVGERTAECTSNLHEHTDVDEDRRRVEMKRFIGLGMVMLIGAYCTAANAAVLCADNNGGVSVRTQCKQ